MTTVGSLDVLIGANISNLSSGLRQADRMLEGFSGGVGQRLTRLGQGVQGVGQQMTLMTAPLLAIGGVGINAASEFESVMAEIEARTGSTGDEMALISDYALQMGSDTAFSAQEAAEAMLQLLTSGQSVEEALITLPAVLDAAAASGEDLGGTADAVTDIMAAFGLPVESAAAVVEALATAAGASSASMGDLAAGFANVGPVAANFGLSVDDTAAALAILAENGIKGAEAGTALKSMLLQMSQDTDTVQGAWETLGTSMYDAEGNMRDLGTVLEEIGTALEGMPVEQQNQVMQDLAGSYGIVALSALTGSISLEDMRAAMDGSAGAAEVAAARMDTLAGATDSAMGSVETLMITALTPLMEDHLKPLVQQFTEVVNQVTAWASANPELAGNIALVSTALVGLGPLLFVAGTLISAVGTAVTLATTALGLILSPVVLLAAGMAAVLVAGGTLDDFLADVGALGGQAGEGLGLVADGVERLLAGDLSGLDVMRDGFTLIGNAVIGLPVSLIENLATAVGNLIGIDVGAGLAAWGPTLETAGMALSIMLDRIKRGLETFVLGVRIEIGEFLSTFRQQVMDASGGRLDIAPDLNIDLAGVEAKMRALQIGEQLNTALSAQLAEQRLDLGQILTFETASDVVSAPLGQLFSAPGVAENLSVEARNTIQRALELAASAGDEAAFNALADVGLELGIDVASLEVQLQNSIDEATARTYEAALLADITVYPNRVDVSPVLAQIAADLGGGQGGGPGWVDPFQRGMASGGDVFRDGLYYLHAGERVSNRAAERDRGRDGGRSGGNTTTVINAYGESPYELARMTDKARRRSGASYG